MEGDREAWSGKGQDHPPERMNMIPYDDDGNKTGIRTPLECASFLTVYMANHSEYGNMTTVKEDDDAKNAIGVDVCSALELASWVVSQFWHESEAYIRIKMNAEVENMKNKLRLMGESHEDW